MCVCVCVFAAKSYGCSTDHFLSLSRSQPDSINYFGFIAVCVSLSLSLCLSLCKNNVATIHQSSRTGTERERVLSKAMAFQGMSAKYPQLQNPIPGINIIVTRVSQ